MRQFTNTKLIERQSRIARYATFGGLGVLVGSLILSMNTGNILIAYFALLIGFVLAYIGSILANKYIREPRADHALEKALKGFDNKHHLYNYLLPAQHVLLTPQGLTVFRVKSIDGAVSFDGKKWRAPFRIGNLIGGMGREPLGDPVLELSAEMLRMKQFLADRVENAALVPIDGYVVFSDPNARVDIQDPQAPAVHADNLKESLRKNKRGALLTPQVYEKLQQILGETANEKTAK